MIEETKTIRKKRDDIRSVCLQAEWEKLRELAQDESSSISSFLRRLINKLYSKKKKEIASSI